MSRSVPGQLVTFAATVTPASPASGTPTGTVTFYEGSTPLHTSTLRRGAAIYTTSALGLTPSSHGITAAYRGDTSFTASTSVVLSELVHRTVTYTTLTSDANPSATGQPVTFAATVTPVSPGSGTPTGTVTFYDGRTALHTATLRHGFASYATSALSVREHNVTAAYEGDSTFKGSKSSTLSRVVHQASTTTTLTSSVSRSVPGQPVTFTASVVANSPASGTPTGTVTFYDGSTVLHTNTLRKGVASYTTTAFSAASPDHSITAVYGGVTTFKGSKSGTLSRVVNQAATTTSLTSDANPGVVGQPVTFAATVTPASPASGTPTGTVTFYEGSTPLHTSTLRRGAAIYTTSALGLTPSSHGITAAYRGDTSFTASTSVVLSELVHRTVTYTTLTSDANPSATGQPVTFAATVTPVSPGSGTPTGTVTFYDGRTALHTATLRHGFASYATSALSVREHNVTAAYEGDSTFKGSKSSTLSRVVHQASTTTTLTSSVSRSVPGQPVTFTASVVANSPASGTPTGTVTFYDGSTVLHTNTLRKGVASYTTTAFSAASPDHSITAVYGGVTTFKGSKSGTLSRVVNQAATTTSLTSDANPGVVGQPVTFAATVTPASPASGTPTGTVTFYEGSTPLHTSTLRRGAAIYTTSALGLTPSSHGITAAYRGDTSFTASTSVVLSELVHRTVTYTTLTSDANPSATGQPVTFAATVTPVSPGSGTPTGTVTFYDGRTALHTATLRHGGAGYTTAASALTSPTHSITVAYGGDTNFESSTSGALSRVVPVSFTKSNGKAGGGHVATNSVSHEAVLASWYGGVNHEPTAHLLATSTTTTVSSGTNPSVYGQTVKFTAHVTPTAATGTVTFYDGGTSIGTGTLSGGVATYTTTAFQLALGSNSITATYGGNGTYATSTSSTLTQTVNQASTTTAVSSGSNPSVYGQTVTFTATVTATAPGSGTPTGTVTFYDGGTSIGTGTLSGGAATYTTTAFQLALGSNSITATYGATANYKASTSSTLTQTVNQTSTSTALSSSSNPSVYGQLVTFTATVTATAPGSGTPTGTVTFYDGGTSIGTGTLSGGAATYTTTATQLALGSNSITATYGATANYKASTSSTLTQTVNQDSTSTALSSSSNPSVYGQTVTFTATVTAVSPSVGIPTGTVTFYDGGTSLGTGTLSSGVATYTTTATQLALGSNSITATYGATANYGSSTSSTLTQTVNQASTSTALSSSSNPSVYGQPVTFTATVTAVSPSVGIPTGTVTFYDGGTSLGTGTLSGGVATYTTTAFQLALGSNSITATYGATANYGSSTSSTLTQTVNQASTSTALSSSSNPSVYGQTVTFTATVTASAPSVGIPTGTVTFYDGGTSIGTGTPERRGRDLHHHRLPAGARVQQHHRHLRRPQRTTRRPRRARSPRLSTRRPPRRRSPRAPTRASTASWSPSPPR